MADFNVSQQVQHAVMDPEGDVILELHDRTLLVSSKIISLASPVFKAMLGPSFTEGRPDASGRSTLKLPKDDPEAIHALFSMLHLQYQLSEADFNYKFLENLTVVADKYDCAKAVRALSTLFTQKLFELEKTWQSLDFGRLLCPAYVFDDPSLFRDVTRMLVYESADSNGIEFNASRYGMSEEMAELIPSEILGKSLSSCPKYLVGLLMKSRSKTRLCGTEDEDQLTSRFRGFDFTTAPSTNTLIPKKTKTPFEVERM